MQLTANQKIMREITSLSPADCFTVSTRLRKELDVPLVLSQVWIESDRGGRDR